MKALLLHCGSFSYKVTQSTPVAESNPPATEGEFTDCVVVLTSVEKHDEVREAEVTAKFIDAVQTFTSRIGCKKVILYPYAHLTNALGSPKFAKTIFASLEAKLKEGFEVHRSPFGFYKEFKVACKGHPLSEAFRDL